jgi:hypothetical protein
VGFGMKLDVKVEVPKIEVPKVDVASAVASTKDAIQGAVSGAVATATGAVAGAALAASSAASSLSTVAGAIADVAVAFTGAIEDIVLEPHLTLDANASYGDTKFEKGPICIRLDMPADEASTCQDVLHLFSDSRSFDERKAVSAFTDQRASTVVVRFENAPMNETFSLEVLPATGTPHLLFSSVPYGDLRKTRQRHL